MNEGVACQGRLRIYKKVDNVWNLELEKFNKVVNTGLALIADRLKDASSNPLSHIAVGTSSTAVTAFDSALGTELFRKAIDNIDTPLNQLIAEVTFGPSEGNGSWGECGIFNNSVGGTMFNRINITYTKNAGEETKLEFTITFTANT